MLFPVHEAFRSGGALLLASLTTLPFVPTSDTPPTERDVLEELESPELEQQRAGASAPVVLEDAERDELRSLDAAADELAGQRAGDITNSDLKTIFLVLGIIAALVIIF